MARSRPRFYLFTAIALCIVTFWGFSQTYFAPLFFKQSAFGGQVSDLPSIVHVHGWSFFLWYLLLLLQTSLINGLKVRLHRRIGALSVALVALMVVTGIIVIAVNIHRALELDGPPIWRLFGLVILATLLLFLLFYGLAIANRHRAEIHKRYMIVASAVGLGAASFRVLLSIFGPHPLNIPGGILATNLIIVAGMIYDRRQTGRVHRVYRIGLPACLVTQLVTLALPHTMVGHSLLEVLSEIGRRLHFLYG